MPAPASARCRSTDVLHVPPTRALLFPPPLQQHVFVASMAGGAMQSEEVVLPAGTVRVGQLKDAVRAKLSAARGGRPVELLQLQLVEDVVGAEATEDALQTAKRVSLGLAGATLALKGVTTGSWLFATIAEPAGALRAATILLAGDINTHRLSGGGRYGHGGAASLVCMSSHSHLPQRSPLFKLRGLPRARACRLWPAPCTRVPVAPRTHTNPVPRPQTCGCLPRGLPSPRAFDPALPKVPPSPPPLSAAAGATGGGGTGVGAPAGAWEGSSCALGA